ncbi:hypothetical protein VOLCADRAFT_106768 [Volvox carteri f. nagariensis]|uniref:N-acetyltransferase domain-containing protein n=1 Tax=Volvox carteri f. nagariensis TaxID=3068 RepID=D8U9L5_VOLCA|nr:uncharacterized protein VOLCADRAFT_106768 [Volvox carteri f. nagariensis]EFJ43602.1 hypothetical protein VOLCADRAFT_106768 [Volvox carteri f. nagariensis]|eukprot:XP_002955302.1 hypothetical protein VOLCADRAFT_106768 [Volvox carteri f. nagariensis]
MPRLDLAFRQGLAARAVGRTDDGQMAGVSRSNATAVVQAAAYGQQGPTIAVLSYRDRPEVAQAAVENIAAAFQDDPSTTYFCRPERRVQYYRSILSCLLDWYPEDKQLVCTLPPDAAAFVHVFPRLRELDAWTKLRRGALVPLGCVRLGRLLTGMDASSFFEGQREDFVKVHGPFLYVSVMAVRPDRQGCGLGSALLAFVCDRADAAGMYCYIEATSLRNRALYERFGFKLILVGAVLVGEWEGSPRGPGLPRAGLGWVSTGEGRGRIAYITEWRSEPNMPYTYILARPPSPLDSRAVPADTVPEAAAAAVVMTRAADAAAHLGGPAPTSNTRAAGRLADAGRDLGGPSTEPRAPQVAPRQAAATCFRGRPFHVYFAEAHRYSDLTIVVLEVLLIPAVHLSRALALRAGCAYLREQPEREVQSCPHHQTQLRPALHMGIYEQAVIRDFPCRYSIFGRALYTLLQMYPLQFYSIWPLDIAEPLFMSSLLVFLLAAATWVIAEALALRPARDPDEGRARAAQRNRAVLRHCLVVGVRLALYAGNLLTVLQLWWRYGRRTGAMLLPLSCGKYYMACNRFQAYLFNLLLDVAMVKLPLEFQMPLCLVEAALVWATIIATDLMTHGSVQRPFQTVLLLICCMLVIPTSLLYVIEGPMRQAHQRSQAVAAAAAARRPMQEEPVESDSVLLLAASGPKATDSTETSGQGCRANSSTSHAFESYGENGEEAAVVVHTLLASSAISNPAESAQIEASSGGTFSPQQAAPRPYRSSRRPVLDLRLLDPTPAATRRDTNPWGGSSTAYGDRRGSGGGCHPLYTSRLGSFVVSVKVNSHHLAGGFPQAAAALSGATRDASRAVNGGGAMSAALRSLTCPSDSGGIGNGNDAGPGPGSLHSSSLLRSLGGGVVVRGCVHLIHVVRFPRASIPTASTFARRLQLPLQDADTEGGDLDSSCCMEAVAANILAPVEGHSAAAAAASVAAATAAVARRDTLGWEASSEQDSNLDEGEEGHFEAVTVTADTMMPTAAGAAEAAAATASAHSSHRVIDGGSGGGRGSSSGGGGGRRGCVSHLSDDGDDASDGGGGHWSPFISCEGQSDTSSEEGRGGRGDAALRRSPVPTACGGPRLIHHLGSSGGDGPGGGGSDGRDAVFPASTAMSDRSSQARRAWHVVRDAHSSPLQGAIGDLTFLGGGGSGGGNVEGGAGGGATAWAPLRNYISVADAMGGSSQSNALVSGPHSGASPMQQLVGSSSTFISDVRAEPAVPQAGSAEFAVGAAAAISASEPQRQKEMAAAAAAAAADDVIGMVSERGGVEGDAGGVPSASGAGTSGGFPAAAPNPVLTSTHEAETAGQGFDLDAALLMAYELAAAAAAVAAPSPAGAKAADGTADAAHPRGRGNWEDTAGQDAVMPWDVCDMSIGSVGGGIEELLPCYLDEVAVTPSLGAETTGAACSGKVRIVLSPEAVATVAELQPELLGAMDTGRVAGSSARGGGVSELGLRVVVAQISGGGNRAGSGSASTEGAAAEEASALLDKPLKHEASETEDTDPGQLGSSYHYWPAAYLDVELPRMVVDQLLDTRAPGGVGAAAVFVHLLAPRVGYSAEGEGTSAAASADAHIAPDVSAAAEPQPGSRTRGSALPTLQQPGRQEEPQGGHIAAALSGSGSGMITGDVAGANVGSTGTRSQNRVLAALPLLLVTDSAVSEELRAAYDEHAAAIFYDSGATDEDLQPHLPYSPSRLAAFRDHMYDMVADRGMWASVRLVAEALQDRCGVEVVGVKEVLKAGCAAPMTPASLPTAAQPSDSGGAAALSGAAGEEMFPASLRIERRCSSSCSCSCVGGSAFGSSSKDAAGGGGDATPSANITVDGDQVSRRSSVSSWLGRLAAAAAAAGVVAFAARMAWVRSFSVSRCRSLRLLASCFCTEQQLRLRSVSVAPSRRSALLWLALLVLLLEGQSRTQSVKPVPTPSDSNPPPRPPLAKSTASTILGFIRPASGAGDLTSRRSRSYAGSVASSIIASPGARSTTSTETGMPWGDVSGGSGGDGGHRPAYDRSYANSPSNFYHYHAAPATTAASAVSASPRSFTHPGGGGGGDQDFWGRRFGGGTPYAHSDAAEAPAGGGGPGGGLLAASSHMSVGGASPATTTGLPETPGLRSPEWSPRRRSRSSGSAPPLPPQLRPAASTTPTASAATTRRPPVQPQVSGLQVKADDLQVLPYASYGNVIVDGTGIGGRVVSTSVKAAARPKAAEGLAVWVPMDDADEEVDFAEGDEGGCEARENGDAGGQESSGPTVPPAAVATAATVPVAVAALPVQVLPAASDARELSLMFGLLRTVRCAVSAALGEPPATADNTGTDSARKGGNANNVVPPAESTAELTSTVAAAPTCVLMLVLAVRLFRAAVRWPAVASLCGAVTAVVAAWLAAAALLLACVRAGGRCGQLAWGFVGWLLVGRCSNARAVVGA